MRITVVIPTFNSEKTIVNTLDSALHQTVPPDGIIVVDDCSTDNTVEEIEQYARMKDTDRIRVMKSERNRGPSSARNIGWNDSNGEFVAFLDSDDVWHIRKLEIIKSILQKNGRIDLIGHGFTTKGTFSDDCLGREIVDMNIKRVSFGSLLLRNCLQSSCVVVRRSLRERFNERMRYNEDHELWARVALGNKVYYLDCQLTALGRAVLTPGGLSENALKMRIGEMQMYLHLARRNRMVLVVFPMLTLFSVLKHLRKSVELKYRARKSFARAEES